MYVGKSNQDSHCISFQYLHLFLSLFLYRSTLRFFLAHKINIDFQVIKLFQDREKIMNVAVSEHKKTLKIRTARKYLDLYKVLLKKFKEARSKGFRIDFNWIWSKARNLHREMTIDSDAIIRKHVVVNFIERQNIRMRAKQRNRKLAKEDFRQTLEEWHITTRERLFRTNRGETYDQKWGSFMLNQRFNVDQSPMPFSINMKETYFYEPGQDQNKEKIWISQPGCRLEKRQCTLHICFRPDGEQPRIGMYDAVNTFIFYRSTFSK